MVLCLQAELLEVDSANLLAEASQDRLRMHRTLEQKAKVEQVGASLERGAAAGRCVLLKFPQLA